MRLLVSITAGLCLLTGCDRTDGPNAIDFGPVVLGTSRSIVRVFNSPISAVSNQHPELVVHPHDGGTRLELTYQPAGPGRLDTAIEFTSASGTESWHVTGVGRPSEVERFPDTLKVPQDGFADLWMWLEPEIQIALAPDSDLALCPGAPCVELISAAVDRGLPVTVRVHGPVNLPTTLGLSTCAHPACRLEVPVQPTPDCGFLVFGAAPVGQDSLRKLTCPGAEVATSAHPELIVVDSSTTAVSVRWSPSAPGPFEAELTRGGQPLIVRGYAVEAPVCRAEVGPTPVVFGAVPVGGFREQEISVRVLGPESCLLSGADAAGPEFTVRAPSPHWMDPGQQSVVQVRLSPHERGPRGGQAWVWLSDGSGGAPVELAGRGVVSDLELLTEALDFGEIETCARRRLPIRVLNHGSVPGLIREARISGQGAEVLQASWPEWVPASDLLSVPVFLSPNFSGSLQATVHLQIESNLAQTSYEVPVRASVSPDFGVMIDEFMQFALPKADVVLVIDPVGPLSPVLAHMQANLSAFAQFTIAMAVDTNLMIVSGASSSTALSGFEPRPGTQRSVFAPQDPDFQQAVVDTALAVARRAPGPNTAIANLHTAVTSSTAVAVLRPEAWLSMIGISLQEDGSGEAAQSWLDRFFEFKGARYAYDAVVGDVPGGCDNGDFAAQAAPRHVLLATQSGGVFQSVCASDWSRGLENLASANFGFKSRFFLSARPMIETLEITVNDAPVLTTTPSGTVRWTYNLATNSITFSPFAIPEPESRIAVKYRRMCR